MKTRFLILLILSNLSQVMADTALLNDVNSFEQKGNSEKRPRSLPMPFKNGMLMLMREKTWSSNWIDYKIKKDFPFSAEELFTELKRAVKGITQQEFDSWVKEGRFDSRLIDGKRWFMTSSVSNLYFVPGTESTPSSTEGHRRD